MGAKRPISLVVNILNSGRKSSLRPLRNQIDPKLETILSCVPNSRNIFHNIFYYYIITFSRIVKPVIVGLISPKTQ